MNRTTILVIGKKTEILESITNEINIHADWIVTKAVDEEQAIEKFHQQQFDVVIFAENMIREAEKKLRKIFIIQNPDIIFLQNDASSSKPLGTEIEFALDKRNKDQRPSFSFTDDALKNAGLNISIQ